MLHAKTVISLSDPIEAGVPFGIATLRYDVFRLRVMDDIYMGIFNVLLWARDL